MPEIKRIGIILRPSALHCNEDAHSCTPEHIEINNSHLLDILAFLYKVVIDKSEFENGDNNTTLAIRVSFLIKIIIGYIHKGCA